MCGIFGITVLDNSKRINIENVIKKLYKLSSSRGKEASGAIFSTKDEINIIKKPEPADKLLKSNDYISAKNNFLSTVAKDGFGVFLGHSRLVTNGSSNFHDNNQPIVKNKTVGVHNGIIVNDHNLWSLMPDYKKEFDVDTEAIISLVDRFRDKKYSLVNSLKKSFEEIKGVANIATVFSDTTDVALASNNGSLYYTSFSDDSVVLFASERYILKEITKKLNLNVCEPIQVHSNSGLLIDVANKRLCHFNFCDKSELKETILPSLRKITDISSKTLKKELYNQAFSLNKVNYSSLEKEFYLYHDKIQKLKRCSKCLLTETMPFIEFDHDGVCNYCRTYKKLKPKGKKSFEESMEKYRTNSGSLDCLVTFSGGRDSSYALHYLKKEMGMNPVAYTYDWGVITDLGRRNQSRMCQQLGVEHIVVSADIKQKRKYINKNLSAWLKKPDIGIVPLFMAGDKHYFYYANKIAKQNNLDLIVINGVALEQTHFKTGFCGVEPELLNNRDGVVRITDSSSKRKLIKYYLDAYLKNTGYINSSLIDTVNAFISYYMISHNYERFFEYIPWDEKIIDDVLVNQYDWETLPGHNTTWRIGDGTSHFYNYIYYIASGLTENDTFRSNQVREGMLTREEALTIADRDNLPNWEAIQWYCETMGLEFEKTILRINSMNKLY